MTVKKFDTRFAVNDNQHEMRRTQNSWQFLRSAVGGQSRAATASKQAFAKETYGTASQPLEYSVSSLNPESPDAHERSQEAEVLPQKLGQPAQVHETVFLMTLGFSLTCLATLIYIFITQTYNELTPIIIPALGLSCAALMIMRSSAAIWLSIMALAVWSALSLMSLSFGYDIPAGKWAIALPILLNFNLIASHLSRSLAMVLASLISAYIWVIVFNFSTDLSPTASGVLLFMVGTAHHKFGKALEDLDRPNGHAHMLMGWAASIAGLLWVQHTFLPSGEYIPNPDIVVARSALLWQIGVGLSIFTIAASGFIRMRRGRLSILGLVGTCTACLILPTLALAPTATISFFETMMQLPAIPYLGMSIGASIIAFALFMLANGLRRGHLIDASLAGAALFAQSVVLISGAYMSMDAFVVICFTILFVACYELMISRRSLIKSL